MMETAKELQGLKDLLGRLQSGDLTLSCGGQDVSAIEIAALKQEIEFFETVLARSKSCKCHALSALTDGAFYFKTA